MGSPTLVIGNSGSGKSHSLKNFPRDALTLISVIGKRPPFRDNNFKYYAKTDNVDTIIGLLQRMPTNVAVIDDAGYLMTNTWIKQFGKNGVDQFGMYRNIGESIWRLINAIIALPDDVTVYLIFHEDQNDFGMVGVKTIGRLLDRHVCIEGMVSVCLRCMTDGQRHWFATQSNGSDITKTPEGMFDTAEIPNDLLIVDNAIRAYWNLGERKTEEKSKTTVSKSETIK